VWFMSKLTLDLGKAVRLAVLHSATLCFAAGLCFVASASAQVLSSSAVFTNASGRVSVERSGELWAASAGQTVNVGQVVVTGADGFAELQLPDGSQLEIFANSRFAYRANQFNLRDAIDLYLGKIRFHIQKLTNDDPSIRVNSPTAVISVRGTVFEVEVDSNETTRITVDEGAVAVRHRLMAGQEVLLHAGESLEVADGVPLAAAKPGVPRTIIGNVVRAVGNTLAQIKSQRPATAVGASGSPAGGGSGSTGSISGSDSGSNESAPPATGGSSDGNDDNSDSSGPPGDRLP
jgi:hypothetical protein